MKKLLLAILVLAILLLVGCAKQQTTIEKACTDSGGTIKTSSCCISASDFPNLCLIGACGCGPGNTHDVKICECGENKCFDGTKCISR